MSELADILRPLLGAHSDITANHVLASDWHGASADQLQTLASKWQAEAATLAHHGESYADSDEQSDDRVADVLTECAAELLALIGATSAPTRCPATGRSASVCEDQTHAGCVAGHLAGAALDRAFAAHLPNS